MVKDAWRGAGEEASRRCLCAQRVPHNTHLRLVRVTVRYAGLGFGVWGWGLGFRVRHKEGFRV